jgi:hypothetical protein
MSFRGDGSPLRRQPLEFFRIGERAGRQPPQWFFDGAPVAGFTACGLDAISVLPGLNGSFSVQALADLELP